MAGFRLTRFELETKGITAKAGEKHVVTVLKGGGKRILVEDAHFHTDSSVFLPRDPGGGGAGISQPRELSNDAFWEDVKKNHAGYVAAARQTDFEPPEEAEEAEAEGTEAGSGAAAGAGGLEAVMGALRFLEANPDHALVVAGHTDRAGTEGHNEELSGARARCVAAVIEGDRAGYVQAAKAHDKPESDGSMLAFAARARKFPCAPANPAKPSGAEIQAFQKAYNRDFGKSIGVDGVVGDETRGAYFDVLDAELALQAGGKDALAALRGKLKFVDAGKKTLACGERFPLDRPDQDGAASQANRRVELLFFPPEPRPDLKAKDAPDAVYHKGTFEFILVDPVTLGEQGGGGEAGEAVLEDAPAPEDGVGEMDGPLATEMAKLQDAPDLVDRYAFLEPFDEVFPEFGGQAVADVPGRGGDSVLV
jgi:hypothetical protein